MRPLHDMAAKALISNTAPLEIRHRQKSHISHAAPSEQGYKEINRGLAELPHQYVVCVTCVQDEYLCQSPGRKQSRQQEGGLRAVGFAGVYMSHPALAQICPCSRGSVWVIGSEGDNHFCPSRDVTWQQQDVRQRLAVVQSNGDDAVRPQPPGAHLVQLPAGGDTVAAGQDPVVGGCGDHHPDPTDEAGDEGAKL
ncbi:hypothetical protein NDU88_000728 [Pleurodeles waltl]|uniref:Uncharacterized protein n=1 Tax=Pleurodeles waltl TaxID=8319 RepID=A0AAV7L7D9_PLEWA|nr:hypothetical protein NDU88_000728 [Pleurodeles waltl]